MLNASRSLFRVLRRIYRHPLNAGHRVQAAARFFAWQIGIRLLRRKAIIDWVDAARLVVGKGETGLTSNLYQGLTEYEDMAFLLSYLRQEECFVDVGANAGAYTVLASAVVGSKTIAFEPLPSTAARLHDQLRINAIGDIVTLRCCAVGRATGELAMTDNLDTTNHVLSASDSGDQAVTVPVVTLDESLPQDACYVLKIDVEGFELEALEGAHNLLCSGNVSAIIVELNGSGQRYGVTDNDVHRLLYDKGYKAAAFDPERRRLDPRPAPFSARGNVIYVRDVEAARDRCAGNPRTFTIHTAWGQRI